MMTIQTNRLSWARSAICLWASLLLVSCMTSTPMTKQAPQSWRLAIHGGAGVITKASMTPEKEAAYHVALEKSLRAGGEVLTKGGTSLDAVQAAILVMEDDPLFNAGVGAVFTADGGHELDASIMDGADRNAGSVAGVKRVRNPILAARAVMDKSRHVMFAGEGADAFAASQGLDMVAPSHFDTERRRKSLQKVLSKPLSELTVEERHGTVGAVAIDQYGNIAAGTSTGGMTAKTPGRIGDSPLIGAATYAQNGVCAVSATGHGEYFIRVGVSRRRFAHVWNWPERTFRPRLKMRLRRSQTWAVMAGWCYSVRTAKWPMRLTRPACIAAR